ncbi:MAG: SH3 domain-containing protein, partial [Pseudomonadota bacterium]
MNTRFALILLLLPVSAVADVVVPIDEVQNSVNIRLEPDATSDVVGRLNQGDSVELVAEHDGWHEVQLEGDATGFISADWTEIVADEPAPEPEPVVEEAPEPAPEPEPVVEEAPEPAPEPEPVVEAAPEPVAIAEPLTLKGRKDFLVRFRSPTEGGTSQVYDDGNRIGIGTTEPQQRLEVNGSIQINEQNSSVAGLMITQSSGETGYIMHNRASTLTIGAGSQDRITIDRDGNVGLAVSRPNHPLEMASGAYVTSGGVWTNRSSRDSKQNIQTLSLDDATAALMALRPVTFEYRRDDQESYAGFVAEEVPELVAMADGESLSAMDIVAVLT